MGDESVEYPPYAISFFTELFGTAIMMYLGCMGCVVFPNLGPIIPAFTFGLSILAVIQTFNHISPVHLNPAISIGFLIMGKIKWQYFLVFLAGQFVGAHLGYGALKLVMPDVKNICLLANRLGQSAMECFFNEIGCSMVFMLLVLGAVDEKNKELKDSVAVRIGFGVTGIYFALEPFTGAGINPIRSLPPALFNMEFDNLWQYLIGPTVGMVIGALVYRFLFDDLQLSLHSFLLKE